MQLKDKIFTIRNQQVMLDRDLAKLYEVGTKMLNQAVKRNIERFPTDFYFQMTKKEFDHWRSQFVTSNSDKMGLRRAPYVFTEHGVTALAGVLKSKIASEISVKIVREFVAFRKYVQQNAGLFQRVEKLEHKNIIYESHFDEVFRKIEQKTLTPSQGIFFEGQLFTAHKAIQEILNKAKKEIILIDNYVDENTLTLFTESKVSITFLTKNISNKLELAVTKFNTEFNKNIILKEFTKSHDRFIILDKTTVYHIGASLKDAGKKWFAINKLKDINDILKRIN